MLMLGSILKDEQQKGWCCRYYYGRFIIAGITWDFGLYSIMEDKAMALKEVVQAAIKIQLDYVIF